MARSEDPVQLFTDGACRGNPGPGGWAFILKHPASGKTLERSGGSSRTTNNRMELRAVVHGLEALRRPSRVELVSDSEYVLNGLGGWIDGWKAKGWYRDRRREKPVRNADLWRRLDALRRRHALELHWTRGHSGHDENERCDALAARAADEAEAAGRAPDMDPG